MISYGFAQLTCLIVLNDLINFIYSIRLLMMMIIKCFYGEFVFVVDVTIFFFCMFKSLKIISIDGFLLIFIFMLFRESIFGEKNCRHQVFFSLLFSWWFVVCAINISTFTVDYIILIGFFSASCLSFILFVYAWTTEPEIHRQLKKYQKLILD